MRTTRASFPKQFSVEAVCIASETISTLSDSLFVISTPLKVNNCKKQNEENAWSGDAARLPAKLAISQSHSDQCFQGHIHRRYRLSDVEWLNASARRNVSGLAAERSDTIVNHGATSFPLFFAHHLRLLPQTDIVHVVYGIRWYRLELQ